MNEEDNQLFLEVIKDNHKAFDTLYYRHKDFLYRKIKYGKLGWQDQDEIGDLMQGIWMNIWKTKNYDPIYTFKTFLVRVCRNHCIDILRKKDNPIDKNSVSIDGEDFREGEVHTSVTKPLTTEEIIMLEQKMENPLALLPKLNDVEREVFLLTSAGKMTQAEIAQAMDLTKHQVRYALEEAIRKLNHLLRNQL